MNKNKKFVKLFEKALSRLSVKMFEFLDADKSYGHRKRNSLMWTIGFSAAWTYFEIVEKYKRNSSIDLENEIIKALNINEVRVPESFLNLGEMPLFRGTREQLDNLTCLK